MLLEGKCYNEAMKTKIYTIYDKYFKNSIGLGFLIALSTVLGYTLGEKQRTFRTVAEFGQMAIQVVLLTIVTSFVVKLLLSLMTRIRDGQVKTRIGQKEYRNWQVFLFYTAVIFLCWMPVFLAYYPSVFAYDAEGQLYQVLASDYSTHHPLIHTLFLGIFYQFGGNVLGSYSAGMAIHSIVQMLLMAMIFGYTLMVLYREQTSYVMRLLLLLFYAAFPTNSILAISTTKDVLFSGLVLLFVIKMYQQSSKLLFGSFLAISVLMLLFRNNAVYAYIVSVPLVFFFWKKSKKSDMSDKTELKKSLVRGIGMVLATLILFVACSALLKQATSAYNGSPREMLSVPLQQMARTRVQHEEEIDAAMRTELDSYISSEWVFAAYNPYLADPVKNRAVIHDNPAGLIKAWVKLGVQFPMTYVDAFLDNSIGYWYLADKSHSTIYGVGTESGFGYLSTDNRTMPAGCEIIEHSYLPGLRAFMERIVSDNEYQKILVLSVIFAPAFYWWLLCLYLVFFFKRKEYKMLLPAVFLVVYYLTLLLSPTVLIRYMYPFVVSVPFLLCLTSGKRTDIVENTCENRQEVLKKD